MKYMGSKAKINMELKAIFDINRTSLQQPYIEPMVGGCNMIEVMKGKRIAADSNKYLIAMWKGLQAGLTYPKEISKEMYSNAKKDFKNGSNEFYSDFLIGWIGFVASFNGRFYDTGYASSAKTKDGITRNYTGEAIKNIINQLKYLQGIEFHCCEYQNLIIPENSVIYCDIPYFGTTKYKTDAFNYPAFYDWAEQKSNDGHKVFISEYWMPEDRFTCIWRKQIKSNLSTQTQNKIESLFIPKKQEININKTLFD